MSGARGLSRLARAIVLAAVVAGLAGCGIWPWSSSRPKLPELAPPTGGATAQLAWKVSLGGEGGVGFQPVVVGDDVLVATRKGQVARLNAGSGAVVWRTELGKPLISAIGSDGDVTVVGARDGSLIALDRAGQQKWSVPTGTEVVTVPAVGLGLVVVRGSDNRVSAYELDSGRRVWSFDRQAPPLVLRQTASIAMDPATAYAGMPGGRLVALSLANGALRWEAAVGMPRGSNEIERIADVVGSPLISGREVCAAAWQGRLACFDSVTGRATWARDLSAAAGIDLDATLIVAPNAQGDLQAFSRGGASVWRQDKLRQRQPSAPLLAGEHVVVGDSLGLVHVLSRDDGSLEARLATDGTAIVGAPVRWRNLALVQTTGGTLYAVAVD